jgi:hypothetical protein
LKLARRQIELEPYQESAHQQIMLSLAQSGQRNEALVHYERFKDLLQQELGVSPIDQTHTMYERLVVGRLPDLPKVEIILRREPRTVGRCPYRGLTAFREEDAPFFFGREEIIVRLLERVNGELPISVIVASSGLGKSSTVFAGLLPRLDGKNDRLCLDLRPGRQPIRNLVGALLMNLKPDLEEPELERDINLYTEALYEGETSLQDILENLLDNQNSTRRLLVVIDQFEELFTLCKEKTTQERFLQILVDASKVGGSHQAHSLHIILNLRADFMGQALGYRTFAELLNSSTQILGPMSQENLRLAIEKPAEIQGAAFEPGLVTRILDDIGQEPGNLPLLEFALTLLWDRLEEGWFTHEAYEEIGRVDGALARYAEEVYLALDNNRKDDAHGVFIQLVQPGQGTEDTRRLAARDEFDEKRWNLVHKLAGKRLVVTGQDAGGRETVELVHEALIREWVRLRDWVENDRAFRVWQEQMRTSLLQWEDSQRNKGALLRGVALSKAENWLIEREPDLSAGEREFIEIGLQTRDERQRAEARRQERERSLERRSRIFLQVLLIVFVLAIFVTMGFAMVARSETRQAIVSSSLSLAANASQALNEKDTTSALVLAMAANRIQEPPLESQRVLLEAAFSPGPRKLYNAAEIFGQVKGPPLSVVITPDGRKSLTGFFDGSIILWDIETGKELLRYAGHAPGRFEPRRIVEYSGVNDIALSPDGLLAISGGDDGNVVMWQVDSGKEIRRFEGHTGAVRAVDISPDGLVGISGGLSGDSLTDPGELILWDLRTGEELRQFEGQTEAVVDLAISPDGRRVIASSGEVIYGGGVSDLQPASLGY